MQQHPGHHRAFRAILLAAACALPPAVSAETQAPAASVTAETSGICDRTPRIRDAIVRKLVSDGRLPTGSIPSTACASVSAADLAAIYSLRSSSGKVKKLRARDLAGLSGLRKLTLRNMETRSLPRGVFDDLTELRELYLSGNRLKSLPAGVFDRLTRLEYLSLGGNELTSLPPGIFDQLTRLISLNLAGNKLESLRRGVFDQLTRLRGLYLERNQLSTLPPNFIFHNTELNALNLDRNRFAKLPEGVLARRPEPPVRSLGPRPAPIDSLKLHGNPGAPFNITPKMVRTDGGNDRNTGVFELRVAEGAPFPLYILLDMDSADTSTTGVGPMRHAVSYHELSFSARSTVAEYDDLRGKVGFAEFTVTRYPGSAKAVTLRGSLWKYPFVPWDDDGHTGYFYLDRDETITWWSQEILPALTGGICKRTLQVRIAILDATGAADCAAVTDAQLARVTTLPGLAAVPEGMPVPGSVSEGALGVARIRGWSAGELRTIKSLKAGDFDGLSALTALDLSGHKLSALPRGIFADLTALTSLDLSGNSLRTLPRAVFVRGRAAPLQSLNLRANPGVTFELRAGFRVSATAAAISEQPATVSVVLADGAPGDLTFALRAEGVTLSAKSVTIAAGETDSNPVRATLQPGYQHQPSVYIESAPVLPRGYAGIAIPGGVENRLDTGGFRMPDIADMRAHNGDTFAATTLPAALGGAYPYTYTVSTLPPGLNFDAATRTLSGRPSATADVTLTYTATDTIAAHITKEFRITIADRPTLARPELRLAFGATFEETLPAAVGGFAPYTYALSGDFRFDAASRTVRGVAAGSTRLAYTATDNTGRLAYATVTLVVPKIPLLITPLNAHKVYGSEDPVLTYEAEFADGDTAATVFSASPLTRAPGENVGYYEYALKNELPFQQEFAAKYDARLGYSYDWWFRHGINVVSRFQIRQKAVTYTSTSYDKVYDGRIYTPSGQSAGGSFAAGDVVVARVNGVDIDDTGLLTVIGGTFENKNVGEGKRITGFSLVGSKQVGNGIYARDNYTLASASSVTGSITPRRLQVTAINARGVEKDAPESLRYRVTGLAAGETAADALTGTLTYAAADADGNFPIVRGSLTATANYALADEDFTPGIFRVDPPPYDATAGICGRTRQVRNEIVYALTVYGQLPYGSNPREVCADITDEMLAKVRRLGIYTRIPNGLKAGDFAGLSGLESLTLCANGLQTLPDGVFDELTELTHLNLTINKFVSLPDGVFDQLTKLENLELSYNKLASLPAGMLRPLTKLTRLDLSNNRLASLPDALFVRAPAAEIETLKLRGNFGAPFRFAWQLARTDDGNSNTAAIEVRLPIGAPAASVARVSARGGTLSVDGVSAARRHITLAAGAAASATFTLTRAPGSQSPVTLRVATSGYHGPYDHSGFSFAAATATFFATPPLQGGVCARTPQVRDALVAATGAANCAAVTDAQLAEVESLTGLSGDATLTALKTGDFAGLGALTALDLSANALRTLPRGIFDELTALVSLDVSGNGLTALPGGVLDELTALTTLRLQENQLRALPPALFARAGAVAVEVLNLSANPGATFELRPGFRISRISAIAEEPASVFVTLADGAPRDLTFTLRAEDATLSAASAVIPAGATESSAIRMNVVLGLSRRPSVRISGVSALPREYAGIKIPIGAETRLEGDGVALPEIADVRAHSGGAFGVTLSRALGGAYPYTYTVSTLPPGLTFDAATRTISGTPLAVAGATVAASVTYTATDTGGARAQKTFAIRIANPPTLADAALTFTLAANAEAVLPAAVGGFAPLTYALSGLPAGVTFDAASRTVRGAAEAAGSVTFAYTATDNAGKNARAQVTLTVHKIPLLITPLPAEKVYGSADPALTYEADFAGDDTAAAVFSATPFLRAPGESAGTYAYSLKDELPFRAGFAAKYEVQLARDTAFTFTPTLLTIRAKLVTYTAHSAGKVYDGTTAAPPELGGSFAAGDLVVARVNGVDIDDTAAVTVTGGTFANPSAGEGKRITGFALSGAAARNYRLGYTSRVTGDITPRRLRVSALDAAGVEKIAPELLGYSVGVYTYTADDSMENEGLIPGENPAAALTGTLTYAAANADGDFPIVRGSLTATANYSLADADFTPGIFRIIDAAAVVDTNGICNRTPEVRDAIVSDLVRWRHLPWGSNPRVVCADITAELLAKVFYVHIDEGKIARLQAHDLAGLSNLQSLTLCNVGLESIPRGAFDHLTKLKNLNLFNNELRALPRGVFDHLTQLWNLTLSANKLQSLPPGVFDHLTQLEFLTLSQNQLQSLADGVFNSLTKLDYLRLTYNQLTELPAGIERLTKLRNLYLSSNQLTSLPDNLLRPLTELYSLGLSGNQLTSLPPGAFDTLTKLEYLYLRGNRLASLSPGAFRNTPKLRWLSLHRNQLASLPPALFARGAGADDIQVLHMESNPGAPFALPAQLVRTDTGNANTATIEVRLPTGAPVNVYADVTAVGGVISAGNVSAAGEYTATIRAGATVSEPLTLTRAAGSQSPVTVSVENNAYTSPYLHTGYSYAAATATFFETPSVQTGICDRTAQIRNAIVQDLVTLEHLPAGTDAEEVCAEITPAQLAEVRTVHIQDEIDGLQAGDFAGLSGLDSLQLVNLGLQSLPGGVFYPLVGLTKLSLHANELTTLPRGVFDRMTRLTHLILSENELANLRPGVFDPLTELQSLSVAANKLTSLPRGVFDRLTKLQWLWLGENEIAPLTRGVFDQLTLLEQLDLREIGMQWLSAGMLSRLTNLREFNASKNRLTTLPENVFQPLTRLRTLNLRENLLERLPPALLRSNSELQWLALFGNRLGALPPGIFARNSAADDLSVLWLYENPGAPFALPVQLTQTAPGAGADSGVVEVRMPTGAPVTASVALTATGGTISAAGAPAAATYTATIAAGATASAAFTLTRAPGSESVTLRAVATAGTDAASHRGYSFAAASVTLLAPQLQGGVCDRTAQVRAAIVAATAAANCAAVTGAQLAGVESLSGLSADENFRELQAGDFAGLSALAELDLSGNAFVSLPRGVFAELSALTSLDLSANSLRTVPQDLLDELSSLTTLRLHGNQLQALPRAFFARENAASLQVLNLRANPGATFELSAAFPATEVAPFAENRARVSVTLPAGAPRDLTFTLSAQSATLSASYLTIAAGGTESGQITATVLQNTDRWPSVRITAVSPLPRGYAGIKIPAGAQAWFENSDLILLPEIADVRVHSGGEITRVTLPAARREGVYTYTREYNYDLSALPPGLTFNPLTRRISGAPAADTAPVTLTYTAIDFTGGRVSREFSLRIAARPTLPDSVLAFAPGAEVEVTLPPASGGFTPYTYWLGTSASDAPQGMRFDTGSRTLRGTAAASGTFVYVVSDDAGRYAEAKVVLTTGKAALRITPLAAEKVYGSADPALTYRATFANSDTADTVFSAIPFVRAPGEAAGEYSYALKTELPFRRGFAARYDVQLTPADAFTITPKAVTYTAHFANKVYDGTAAAPPELGGSFAAGDLVRARVNGVDIDDTAAVTVAGGTFKNKNVGEEKRITGFELRGDASANYALAETSSVYGAILPRRLQVSVNDSQAAQKAAPGDLSCTIAAGAADEGLAPGDTEADALTGNLAYGAATAAGSYPIVRGSLAATANYVLDDADFTPGVFVIFDFDVDADSEPVANDGIMIARYFLGVRGETLTAGQSTQRADVTESRIAPAMNSPMMDVDASGARDELDGILLARYMLGLRGAALVAGIAEGKAELVERNIRAVLGE